jgi:hypothetical protein
MSRMKTFLSLALIGFALGVVGYALFKYAKTVNVHYDTAFLDSVIDAGRNIVTSPWFISGLAGSVLLVSIAIAIAYILPRNRS